eukprot:SAG11_NODE_1766_length_4285_cov_2.424032_3_plen_249_part_00
MSFATGQGVGRTQLIRLDPEWLLDPRTQPNQPTKAAGFSTATATTSWNQPSAIAAPEYVSTCMYYRHFPSVDAFDCFNGHDGTSLQHIPSGASREGERHDARSGRAATTQALCMTLADKAEMATALWNFPSTKNGTITAVVQSTSQPVDGGFNASWALADAAFSPWDLQEHHASVFVGGVPQLPSNRWSTLSFAYDLDLGRCNITLNGKRTTSSPVHIRRRNNEGALSYFALRSLRQIYVESLSRPSS